MFPNATSKVRFYFVWFKIRSLKTGFSYIIEKVCIWVPFIKLSEWVIFININGGIFKNIYFKRYSEIVMKMSRDTVMKSSFLRKKWLRVGYSLCSTKYLSCFLPNSRWCSFDGCKAVTFSQKMYIGFSCPATREGTFKFSFRRHTDRYLKTLFRKVLFIWSSMPIFGFIGYTLTLLFRKPDNRRQIYE